MRTYWVGGNCGHWEIYSAGGELLGTADDAELCSVMAELSEELIFV